VRGTVVESRPQGLPQPRDVARIGRTNKSMARVARTMPCTAMAMEPTSTSRTPPRSKTASSDVASSRLMAAS
jgi:hypothetical protein